MTHPARNFTYQEILDGLQQAVSDGAVSESLGQDGLSLYCYTRSCVYNSMWNDISLISRGLIIDKKQKRLVATPFPKFFNIYERDQTIPALPFETFEKLDGSLAIVWFWNGEWFVSTKGSFQSTQAITATAWLRQNDLSFLDKGTTYLFEWVSPDNRIVIHYSDSSLVVIGGYREDGMELSHDECLDVAARLKTRVATRHSHNSIIDLLETAKNLTSQEEGFVVRFSDGLRIKIKGSEYKRIHSLVSNCTPLALWAAMEAGDDLLKIRQDLPEEFWNDFDSIVSLLEKRRDDLIKTIDSHVIQYSHLTDKEVGLRLVTLPEDIRSFIFPWRKSNGNILQGKSKSSVYKAIRPSANRLEGYSPSYAMHKVIEDI